MWSKKLYFFWESGSGECDDCGWYDSLHLVVKNDLGEELLNEYSDSHLAGGDILYESTRLGFLLEKAGYGTDWMMEYVETIDSGEVIRVITADGSLFGEYSESDNIVGKVFEKLGHDMIQQFSTEKDDWGV